MHPDFAPPPRERVDHPFSSPFPYVLGPAALVLGLLLGAVALAGCGGEAEPDAAAFELLQPNATPVEVVAVSETTFEDVIELTGTVSAGEDAQLSPSASGVLTYVAPVGARVGRGGVVARVDAGTQRAGVAQARGQLVQSSASVEQAQAGIRAARSRKEAAEAQLRLAREQIERQRPLLQQQIISPLEFEQVQSQFASAQAQVAEAEAGIAQAQGQLAAARGSREAAQAGVASAQSQLSNTTVRAPFGGVVEGRLMEPGELASPGQPVVRLVGGGGLRVEAGVPERYSGEIEVGTQVTVTPSAYDAGARGGRVVFVGTAVDPASRTFPIEVVVDNGDGVLRPEMVVEMTVTRRLVPNALVLPQGAVVRNERGTSVFVAVAADTSDALVAERRPVRLGASSGGEVVVAEGLRPGDRVVVSGQDALADGDVLEVETRAAQRRQPHAPSAPLADASAGTSAATEPRR